MTEEEIELMAFRESPAPQLITSDRIIINCNRAFARLFGYDRTELLQQSLLILYPSLADYELIGERCLKWLYKNKYYADERFMQHKNGEIFWARARGITMTPENPFGLMTWNFERIHNAINNSVNLTAREREVSSYIVNGYTCKETARKLGISHRTVEVHRARLMKKLDAKNTADLVSKIVLVE